MLLARRVLNSKSKNIFKRNLSISGGKVIFDKLVENNVTDIFLYSGGAIMPAVDSFYNNNKIKYYINTHEQSLGHSATAYAKSTGKPGICMVTSGPGLTNLITPITDANNDSTPLIVFSGNVPLKVMGTQAFQECPSTDITKPITKWSHCVKDVNTLPYVIDRAFDIATSGRPGAVHIDLPKCITSACIDTSKISNIYETESRKYNLLTIDDMISIGKLINSSKKPIIIAGQGCNNEYKYVREFAIKNNIPVTTTIHAMGIFDENHDLSLQFLGMHGNPAANFAIQESDLIINLGSRFDDRTTGNVDKYAPEAFKAFNENRGGIIHVNISKDDIKKNINSHFNFNLPCEYFLDCVKNHTKYQSRKEWLEKIHTLKKEYKFSDTQPDDNKLNVPHVIREINNNLINKKFKITTGVGNHQMWAAQYIKYNMPKTFITSGSLGVMGAGLPYAIGVQIGNPDYLVIDIDGDGSFNQTLSELKTISNYNLPIKIAIMNDGKMSMVRAWEKLFFNQRYTATDLMKNPDYCLLAESFGIKGIRCDNISNLSSCVKTFLEYDGPILCDFKVLSEMCFPLVKPGNALDDMLLHNNSEFNDIDVSQVPG